MCTPASDVCYEACMHKQEKYVRILELILFDSSAQDRFSSWLKKKTQKKL